MNIKTVGKIIDYEVFTEGVLLNCENADVQISFYSVDTVRVEVAFERTFEKFSYSVEAAVRSNLFTFADKGVCIELGVEKFIVRISKPEFYLTFITPDGKVINRDEPGLPNMLVEHHAVAYKTLQRGERFIGLGEKCGPFDKRGRAYTDLNTDSFAYTAETDPLYSSFPFYTGLHSGLCYGIFLDTLCQSDFNFGASNNRFSSFTARCANLNYYFIHSDNVSEIVRSYVHLTGLMPLPPLWSLGYHQNRYSYYPDTEVLRIASTLREKQIPCDSVTLDIHYMDDYRIFTWNEQRFPAPEKMVAALKQQGFRTVLILDPGVPADSRLPLEGCRFLKYPDGVDYEGEVWAGWCRFPDFTSPETRQWWAERIAELLRTGIDGLWNDMNEIATWGQNLPDNLVFDCEGESATHLKVRNVYGLQMVRAGYEAVCKVRKTRPFLLTRAAYSGVQRYSAVWTGDNTATEAHLFANIRMLVGLGLTGVAFAGMDVGGFLGEATPTLYTRWMQVGAFIPYMRNHKQVNTKSAEPWTYGEETLEISRNYINLRYRLLPYIYSIFRQASQTGIPVMRTLAFQYPFDDKIYDPRFENQYFFGDALMVAPFADAEKFGEIYLPEINRYNLYDDVLFVGGKQHVIPLSIHVLPVFVNESAIIPMQDVVQHSGQTPANATLYLHIYKGKRNKEFVYYEDDGETFDYQNQIYCERRIVYQSKSNALIVGESCGSFVSQFRRLKLVLHGFVNISRVRLNGEQQTVIPEHFSFLDPISAFQPQSYPKILSDCKVLCIETAWIDDEMRFDFE